MHDLMLALWVLVLLWAVGFVCVAGLFLSRADVGGVLDRLERVALLVGWSASWARVAATAALFCGLLLWPVVLLKMLWHP